MTPEQAGRMEDNATLNHPKGPVKPSSFNTTERKRGKGRGSVDGEGPRGNGKASLPCPLACVEVHLKVAWKFSWVHLWQALGWVQRPLQEHHRLAAQGPSVVCLLNRKRQRTQVGSQSVI